MSNVALSSNLTMLLVSADFDLEWVDLRCQTSCFLINYQVRQLNMLRSHPSNYLIQDLWFVTGMITRRFMVRICTRSHYYVLLTRLISWNPVSGPARSAEFAFLTTGKLPKAADEMYVTIYPPGQPRPFISDPYSVPIGPLAGDIYWFRRFMLVHYLLSWIRRLRPLVGCGIHRCFNTPLLFTCEWSFTYADFFGTRIMIHPCKQEIGTVRIQTSDIKTPCHVFMRESSMLTLY